MGARCVTWFCVAAVCTFSLYGTFLDAQVEGPITAPPKYETRRIPDKPNSPPPAIPVDELIHRVIANEDTMKQAYEHYEFTQTLRIQELADQGGTLSMTGLLYTKPDGRRYEHVTDRPKSTLKYANVGPQNLGPIRGIPLFLLTSDQAPYYDIQYLGKEKLDELDTYILRLKPKQLQRTRTFFDGVIWVDDQDLAIVKSSGQFVTDISDTVGGDQLPFRMFDVYCENIEGKYWFPTYVSSDDYLKVPDHADVHMKLVIRSTDFKLETAATKAPTTQPPADASPGKAAEPNSNPSSAPDSPKPPESPK